MDTEMKVDVDLLKDQHAELKALLNEILRRLPDPDAVAGSSELLTAKQAGKYLGMSHATMYRHLNNRKDPLPSFKIGQSRKFRVDQLNWWLEKHSA